MFYDYIIIGGGISGLFLAYKIHLLYPNKKVVLIEKERHLGGRVYTFQDSKMTVEMGAGRFSFQHTFLMQLIKELGLSKKMMKNGNNVGLYAPSDGTSLVEYNRLYSNCNGNGSGLIQKVIIASKHENKDTLMKQSFSSYASTILTKEEVQHIKDSFGYYSELIIMNAYDAIQLLDEFNPDIEYYSLKGGLSQIISGMEKKLNIKFANGSRNGRDRNSKKVNVKQKRTLTKNKKTQYKKYGFVDKLDGKGKVDIMRHKKVVDIKPIFGIMGGSGFEVYIQDLSKRKKTGDGGGSGGGGRGGGEITDKSVIDTTIIRGKICICAIPKQAMYKMKFIQNTHVPRLLNSIECGSLCRIYSIFDKDASGKVWFEDYPKFTTNNELRMVIPIDPNAGIIMTSYTDNKYADYWNDLYRNEGVHAVNMKLKELMKNSLGIDIPIPKHTQVFYWKCGVGYWGIGANSDIISRQIQKPFDELDLYICGEHYSNTHQQWMEGALETAHQVLGRICA